MSLNLMNVYMLFLISIFSVLKSQDVPVKDKFKIDHSKEIIFGQSRYKSGSFKLYGDFIEYGILACFNSINEKGGINGKKLRLISMDDKGEPVLAEKNIRKMLTDYKIDMFLGNMGTRSILKVLPLIRNEKIVMFFPWGGDPKLRDSSLRYIISGPGFIKPQVELLVNHIINNLGFKNIAIFHSDDSFSTNVKNETIELLKEYDIKRLTVADYNRFTMNIRRPADKLLNTDPKVIICIATSHPTVKLINRFFEKGDFGTTFVGIDSTFLVADILKEKGARFFYTASVPDPKDTSVPIVKEYQENTKKFFPDEIFNSLSLTYYICAKIIVTAIQRISGLITKEKIIEQIEQMQNYDLGGFKINFDFKNRYAFGQTAYLIKG
ncbi:ABC transporter substrate-binding protein [Candidatus Dependentiae bacterium]|nr:ABC transporter substrate-binding protein [Candidatus Dependentiae bacterium]